MKTIAFILFGCLLNKVSAGMVGPPFPSCLKADTTYNQENIVNTTMNVKKPEDCQDLCSENCEGFTWMDQDSPIIPNVCLTFSTVGEEVPCQHCISGPPTCSGSCYEEGECQHEDVDNVLDVYTNVNDISSCIDLCTQNTSCKFVTYFNDISPQQHFCILYTSCQNVDHSCAGCITSPRTCEVCDYEDTVDGHCNTECGEGEYWFEENCYKVLGGLEGDFVDRDDCRSKCRDLGGDITSVHSLEENEFLSQLVQGNSTYSTVAYLGADCTSGTCVWLDNTPFDYQNWAPGYPTYEHHKCVGLVTVEQWWHDIYKCDDSFRDCVCKL